MISKNKLRGKLKSTPYSHENFSGIVLEAINNLITNKTVCTYIPLPSEIRFNEYLLNSKLLTTSCLIGNEFSICELSEPYEKNKYGIYQPVKISLVQDVDIFFIPGLGFDMKGTRLGRGRGIYDSILSNYSDSVFIGVTDENHICKSIPFEDHDVPMNALVTPKRFIPINL